MRRILVPSVLVLLAIAGHAAAADFSSLTGPYLGQDPPGATPIPFCRGLISFRHSSIAMSPDGNEIYWAAGERSQRSSRIYMSRRSGDGWSSPIVLFDGLLNADCPVVSPDGQRLYLNSIHPLVEGERETERIWMATRVGDGWGPPTVVGEAVNALGLHWTCSVDAGGNLYVGGVPPQGSSNDDIFVARNADGIFLQAVRHPVSTQLEETTPFIEPGGGYLLVSRIGADGAGHIAASFPRDDGAWTDPVALELGGLAYPVCPYVSPDGLYLFVLSGAQVFWVSSQIIEDARALAFEA